MCEAKVIEMQRFIEDLRFVATESSGEVSAVLDRPLDPRALLALSHGAGAGMRHRFMQSLTDRLVDRGLAVFRYQFPYMEQGRKRPDPTATLLQTIRSAVGVAREISEGLPLLAGGKSMGGRLTSHVAATGALGDVRGLVFYGFPLHAPGKPGTDRAAHLPDVPQEMLFLQGPRDSLAKLDLITRVVEPLGPKATLHVVEGADHGFHVLKRSGRTDEQVLDELADETMRWASNLLG
jgi:predicted alpha/beta-hydrolase family hydrolase